jgi:beta-glucosidase
VCAVAAIFGPAVSAAPETMAAACVHPRVWPEARSRGLVDAATEARIDGLLARMSLEEKVGQIIQTDISAVVPEDLARYPARLDSRRRQWRAGWR